MTVNFEQPGLSGRHHISREERLDAEAEYNSPTYRLGEEILAALRQGYHFGRGTREARHGEILPRQDLVEYLARRTK